MGPPEPASLVARSHGAGGRGFLRGITWPEGSLGSRPHHGLSSRMLLTGAVGSLLLDRYGWPSVFYFSGGLTLLWVCYVYKCLLNGKGTVARWASASKHSCPGRGGGPVPVPSRSRSPSAGRRTLSCGFAPPGA